VSFSCRRRMQLFRRSPRWPSAIKSSFPLDCTSQTAYVQSDVMASAFYTVWQEEVGVQVRCGARMGGVETGKFQGQVPAIALHQEAEAKENIVKRKEQRMLPMKAVLTAPHSKCRCFPRFWFPPINCDVRLRTCTVASFEAYRTTTTIYPCCQAVNSGHGTFAILTLVSD
jgi:hypothetical protein